MLMIYLSGDQESILRFESSMVDGTCGHTNSEHVVGMLCPVATVLGNLDQATPQHKRAWKDPSDEGSKDVVVCESHTMHLLKNQDATLQLFLLKNVSRLETFSKSVSIVTHDHLSCLLVNKHFKIIS